MNKDNKKRTLYDCNYDSDNEFESSELNIIKKKKK